MRRSLSVGLLAGIALVLAAVPVAGHTDTDVVAVPAGEEAVVTLKPTHGCGGSPTVQVTIRADVADASPVDVAGWTASATPDGEGRTVVEWSGGTLPADQTGEFPVRFTAPDQPGELLRFPAIQRCADGQELAWIDGDPEGQYPAPRLLVLPAGSAPASGIDEVAPDAPGRDQLVEIVDVDNPEVDLPDSDDAAAPATTDPTTTTSTPSTSAPDAADMAAADPDEGDGTGLVAPVLVGLAVAGLAAAALSWRRRS